MSRRHKRLTVKSIMDDMVKQKLEKRNETVETGGNNSESQNLCEGSVTMEDFNVSEYDEDLYFGRTAFPCDEKERTEREEMWEKLSFEEMNRMYFLLSTTQSKASISRYFKCHATGNAYSMEQLMLQYEGLVRVELCSVCAADVADCLCDTGPTVSEIAFGNLINSLDTLLVINGDRMHDNQQKVLRNIKVSSPISHGFLRERLIRDMETGKMRVHLHCSFDGIRLHLRGRSKVWPFTLYSLDLDDRSRSHHRSVFLGAVFIGKADPSSLVHDRIIRWVLGNLKRTLRWKGLEVSFVLASANHDDQARRKVYNLKAHSSKGSCCYCLNQGTTVKINDSTTVLREAVRSDVPAMLEDGITETLGHSFFNTVIPMYLSPVDLFHNFEEGAFDKIINETFGKPKYKLFERNCSLNFNTQVFLPSRYRTLSGRIKEITGCEKSLIFESIVISAAVSGSLPPIPTVLILALHCLYRLNMDPSSIGDTDLHKKVSGICRGLAPFVEKYASDFLKGSKIHQILYHLPRSTELYGSLLPMSTQVNEHFYHTLQRNLCPELTNGLSSSLLRNISVINELQSEVSRRLETDSDLLLDSPEVQNLCKQLRIISKPKIQLCYECPANLCHLKNPPDIYYRSYYVHGVRYASDRSSASDDTHIMYRWSQTVRCIVEPLLVTDSHLENLARRLLDSKENKNWCQKFIDSVCHPMFGGLLYQRGSILTIPICQIIGHSILVNFRGVSCVLPFAYRTTLS